MNGLQRNISRCFSDSYPITSKIELNSTLGALHQREKGLHGGKGVSQLRKTTFIKKKIFEGQKQYPDGLLNMTQVKSAVISETSGIRVRGFEIDIWTVRD